MKTARGFGLVELIVIAGVLPSMVLVILMVPALTRVRENAKRANCAANLHALGKGFAMYCNENGDRWPWMAGKDWDTTPTGKGRNLDGIETERCVTALPFMLVSSAIYSGSFFVCPSDNAVTPDLNVKDAKGRYACDFSSDSNISYSYACPMSNNTNGVVNGKSGMDLVVMADKTPAYDGGKADTDWSSKKLTYTQKADGMSQNHWGDSINTLFIDCHVAYATEAALVKDDNFYSASGDDDISASGVLGMKNHKSFNDS